MNIPICFDTGIIKVMRLLSVLIYITKIIIPVLLIILGIHALMKCVISGDEDAYKANIYKFLKKIFVGAFIFFIPTICFSFFSNLRKDFDNSKSMFSECFSCLFSPKHCEQLLSVYSDNYLFESDYERPNVSESPNIIQGSSGSGISYLEMHYIVGVSDDDTILIRTMDKTILVDGGRWQARDKIIKYLKAAGVTKIDALIGSHVHWNHVQAHAAIVDSFEVDKMYYSVDVVNCVKQKHCKSNDIKYLKDKVVKKNLKPIILKSGDKLSIGDMELFFIGPNRKLTTYQNANSLTFILKYKNNKFMLTGDTPASYTTVDKMLPVAKKHGMDLNVDVLKLPHHGYETLKLDFYKATSPKYVIIPNGAWCSKKYPSSTNKKNMKAVGAKYYQTCDNKNILLISDGNNITLKSKVEPKPINTYN